MHAFVRYYIMYCNNLPANTLNNVLIINSYVINKEQILRLNVFLIKRTDLAKPHIHCSLHHNPEVERNTLISMIGVVAERHF